jgi:hypothetical protein
MSTAWNTKYGPRRVRYDPPTLEEAIFAAQGLTDDAQQQARIAASLMDLPVEQVTPEVLKARAKRSTIVSQVAFTKREGAYRSVVVERKPARRTLVSGPRAGASVRPAR